MSESAELEPTGDVDYFRGQAAPASTVVVDIDARMDGSSLDAVVAAFGGNGALLGFNDDASPPGQPPSADPYIEFQSPPDGTFRELVAAFGTAPAGGSPASHGPYTISVRCAP